MSLPFIPPIIPGLGASSGSKLPAPPPPIKVEAPLPPPAPEGTAETVKQEKPEAEAAPRRKRNPLRVDRTYSGPVTGGSGAGLNIPM